MSALEIVTEPLGGSPLAIAALERRTPTTWYAPRPADVSGWRGHVDRIRGSLDPRWLERIRPAAAPSGAAAARLDRCVRDRGVVITTGQQPGLFGGPAYVWFKALTALALADALEAATAVPTAVLFWAATDDADFAEASRATIAVPGGVEQLQLPQAPPSGTPMSQMPLGDIRAFLDVLERGSGSASNAAVLELVRAAYVPTATVGGAFVQLLRGMLEPRGIAVLDASHDALRQAISPLLVRALREAPAVAGAVHSRTAEIAAAGYAAQVTELPKLSLVFARDDDDGTKQRVPVAAAQEIASGRDHASLSPTVLLRPLAERAAVPTAAYVAGPAEIAYFAQASAVAAALDTPMPVAVPRWSGTIVQPHVRRILDRYALAPDDLRDPHAAETELAREALPHRVRQALDGLRHAVSEALDRLPAEPAGVDPVLPPRVIEGHRRGFEQRVDRLERRYVSAAKRRAEAMRNDIATARGALYPHGRRQERVLNLIPLIARHGSILFDEIETAARRHAAVLLGEAVEATARR